MIVTPVRVFVRWYSASTTYSGMISPACGSMRIPIMRTMKIFRPVKRNFASATAARKASTIESATATDTTIKLFFTLDQKYGRLIASRK